MSNADEIQRLRALAAQRYQNALNAGKEGPGTHRNSGDSGRVAALWSEAKRDLASALEAQEVGRG